MTQPTANNKFVVWGIKVIPALVTFLTTIHAEMLLYGVKEPISISIATALLLLLLVLLSIRFSFCPLHKALVAYAILMALCVCVQKFFPFGLLLALTRGSVLISGVLLCAPLIKKMFTDEGKCE